MSTDPKSCGHLNVNVGAHVERVMKPSNPNVLGALMLHVTMTCTDCGAEFWFPGLNTGHDYTAPTTSTDGFTLNVPVTVQNQRNQPDMGVTKTIIGNTDMQKGYRAL